MRERTLVLIKPDAVVNYHIGDIISRYEKEKFVFWRSADVCHGL